MGYRHVHWGMLTLRVVDKTGVIYSARGYDIRIYKIITSVLEWGDLIEVTDLWHCICYRDSGERGN